MAPHFFIPEGARSGICRDSALRSTGQAITMTELSTPRAVGSLLPSPVPHGSSPAVLGWDCSLL